MMMVIKTKQLSSTICGIMKTIANTFIPLEISKVRSIAAWIAYHIYQSFPIMQCSRIAGIRPLFDFIQ